MNDLAAAEFVALRDTIQTRGGARPFAFLFGLMGWAVVLTVILIWLPNPMASVVPLLVLLGTFEVVRSLHLGVERIGRYLQVFYEEDASGGSPKAPPAWEHTAMVFGPRLPGAGVHPFFLPVLLLADLVNFLAVVFPGPLMVEVTSLAVPHLALIVWMVYCDRGMRKQRATELARFRTLRETLAGASDSH